MPERIVSGRASKVDVVPLFIGFYPVKAVVRRFSSQIHYLPVGQIVMARGRQVYAAVEHAFTHKHQGKQAGRRGDAQLSLFPYVKNTSVRAAHQKKNDTQDEKRFHVSPKRLDVGLHAGIKKQNDGSGAGAKHGANGQKNRCRTAAGYTARLMLR